MLPSLACSGHLRGNVQPRRCEAMLNSSGVKVGRALPLASGSQLDGQAQETAGDDDGFGLPRLDGKVRLSHVLIQEEISGILLLERLTHVS